VWGQICKGSTLKAGQADQREAFSRDSGSLTNVDKQRLLVGSDFNVECAGCRHLFEQRAYVLCLREFSPQPVAKLVNGIEQNPSENGPPLRELGVRDGFEGAHDRFLPQIFRIEVVAIESFDQVVEHWREESEEIYR
jgi:hypothetical protein